MVNYKIGIFNRKESSIIDLEKLTGIKTLENLDALTSSFSGEEQFKLYLFRQGLISSEQLKQNLCIMYKYNGKIKKLPITYENMKKYLDPAYIKYNLQSLSNDIFFLEKLARHYSIGSDKYNPQGVNVSVIRTYISDVRKNNGNTFYSKSLEIALNDMWNKAVFKSLNKETGEVKINYRGLRDLGLFQYKYDKSLEIENVNNVNESVNNEITKPEKIKWTQEDFFDKLDSVLSETEEVKSDKWVLSSEGDPDFPPNSEEEADYNEYLEYLEEQSLNLEEEHDHYRR